MKISQLCRITLFSLFFAIFGTSILPQNALAVPLTIEDVSRSEGSSPMTFTIQRSDTSDGALSVDVVFTPQTATGGGVDFTSTTQTVSFTGGQTSRTFTVALNNDTIVEEDETFMVSMTNCSNGTVDITDTAIGTILDNDTATVTLSASDATAAEPNNNGQFRVTMTRISSTDTVINYSVNGSSTATSGADYVALSGTVTIPAGATTANIAVTVIDDLIVEASETVRIDLDSFGAHDPEITFGATTTATVTISDNDTATVSIAANIANAAEPAVNGQFTLTQSKQSSTDTVIRLTRTGTAASGTDYAAIATPYDVTIPAGATTATIDVTVIDDNIVEANETIILTLNSRVSGDTDISLAGAPNNTATVTIIDDDTATLSIAATITPASETGPVNGLFTVTQSKVSSTNTVINCARSGTATSVSDFSTINATFTVTIAAGSTTATIPVNVVDDAIVEESETVIITLVSRASGDTDISVAAAPNNSATVVIDDNDSATVSISATDNYAAEPTNNGRFRVTQTAVSSTPTDIHYAMTGTAVNGSDYNLLSGSVIIPAGSTYAEFTVTVIDDTIVEASETVIATIDAITSGDADITLDPVPAARTATITIDANDSAAVTIEDVTVNEGDGTLTFTATVNNAVDGGFTVTAYFFRTGDSASKDIDYTGTDQVITFVGNAGETQAIVVPIINDTIAEGNEFFTVRMKDLAAPVVSTARITITDRAAGTIIDNERLVRFRANGPFGMVSHNGDPTSDYIQTGYTVHTVNSGSDLTFTVTAIDPCPNGLAHSGKKHHVSSIINNGSPVPNITGQNLVTTAYTLSGITIDHTIDFHFTSFVDVTVHGPGRIEAGSPVTATFTPPVYTGSVEVEAETSQLFTNVPNAGEHVLRVRVDGVNIGVPDSYTFTDMNNADHTYEVWFDFNQFTLTPISRYNTIFNEAAETTKATVRTVDWHTDSSFYVNLNDPVYSIHGVLIDNIKYPIPAIDDTQTYPEFTLTNVGGDHLKVEFTNIVVNHRLEAIDYDTTPISDSPLDVGIRPQPASVMFVLDDSGSMDWEVIVAGVNNGLYEGQYYVYSYPNNAKARVYGDYSLQKNNTHNRWKSQWSGVNKMFYNPEATYVPWPTFTGTPSSLLPAVAADGQAHANIYFPRFHPRLSVDCTDAINKANGVVGADLAKCDTSTLRNNVFNADAAFLTLAVDPATVVTVDNSDPGFVLAGSWGVSTNDPKIGVDYNYTETNGTDTATWRIIPMASGEHLVEAFWPKSNNRWTDLSYAVTCSTCGDQGTAGTKTVSIDQRNQGDTWLPLGNFTFTAGETVSVKLTDTRNTTSSAAADAVRIGKVTRKIINAHYYTWNDANGDGKLNWDDANGDGQINIGETVTDEIYLVNLTDPIQYFKVIDNTLDVSDANLVEVLAADMPPTVKVFAQPAAANAWLLERQNWADWYSYYRKRNLAATGSVAQVIDRMEDVKVGLHTINYNGNGYKAGGYGYSQSLLPVNVPGLGDETNKLLDLLYGFQVSAYGTPLRNGLYAVGQYYDNTDDSPVVNNGGIANNTGSAFGTPIESPYKAAQDGDECKQVFAIIMTDGYWNGGGPNLGNVDGDNGVPYADTYSNTLADVAMHFFERDLSTVLENLVPDGVYTHQHMVTYSVAFGVTGTLNPSDYDFNPALPGTDYPTWPQAVADSPRAVDDLWHAAVNGHGLFMNASRPDQLVQSMLDIMNDIGARLGSGASVSVNGDELYESVGSQLRMFQTSYNSADWHGDLKAYKLHVDTGDILYPEAWSAEKVLATRLGDPLLGHNDRIIGTFNGISGIPFRWNVTNLNVVQQTQLQPYFSQSLGAEDVLNYLRGEGVNEGVFRVRDDTHPLGDMVNSVATYEDGFLYVGANDGMLHAFHATDGPKQGKELFAYVPSQMYSNLRRLAYPLYEHRYFVDNTPYTKKISNNLTLLVGGYGKGGQGYYCLDITDAGTIDSEASLASRVRWEYPAQPATLLSGDTFSFVSAGGAGGNDQIRDSAKRFTSDKFTVGKRIAVIGANFNDGVHNGSNDGVYKITAVAADNSSIDIEKGSLITGYGDGKNIIITQSTSDPGLGYSFSKAFLVETNDQSINAADTDLKGWVVVFGNGYSSEDGTASLYVLNPKDGTLLMKIETKVAGNNGMSSPTIIDTNNDLKADYVYAGDLLGNMWKFDFTSSDYKNWQVAYCDNSDTTKHCRGDVAGMIPKPLFTAKANQPITAAPDVTNHHSNIGYTVIFGTGKYIGEPDLDSYDTQSLYGIWDWAPDNLDSGYHGLRIDTAGPPSLATLSNWSSPASNTLLQQVAWVDGIVTEDTNGNLTLDPGEDTNDDGLLSTYGYFRIMSNYEGDWSTVASKDLDASHKFYNVDINGDGSVNVGDKVPIANTGWFFDLPGKIDITGDLMDNDLDGVTDEIGERIPGERVVNDTIIRDGRAIMISFALTGTRCNAGAYSFVNEINPNTGGMIQSPVFDLNGDGLIDESDYVLIQSPNDENGDGTVDANDVVKGYPGGQPIEGRLQNPSIVEIDEETEAKYLSSSQGSIQVVKEKAITRGVYMWQQVH